MDTGLGEFAKINGNVAKKILEVLDLQKSGIFQVGETLEIRGSKFRVEKIKPHSLRLLLLPQSLTTS